MIKVIYKKTGEMEKVKKKKKVVFWECLMKLSFDRKKDISRAIGLDI